MGMGHGEVHEEWNGLTARTQLYDVAQPARVALTMPANLQVAWAGNHTLASASEKDNVVRMYNFDTEDNYVLNLEQDSGLVSRVVCLAYDDR